MKKITLLFSITLLLLYYASAQNYRPMLGNSGDVVNIWGVEDEMELWDIKFVFIISEDTVINTTPYRIVDTYEMSLYYPGHIDRHFMREDTAAKKVYVLDESSMTDVLLYDFSLSVGDSIYLEFGDTSVNLPTGTSETNYINSWFKVKNEILASSAVDTSKYRVLYLESDSMMQDFDTVPQNMYWIEGVGCSTTFDYRNGIYPKCITEPYDIIGMMYSCHWTTVENRIVMSPQYIYQKSINGNCVFRSDSIIDGYCHDSSTCPCATTIAGLPDIETPWLKISPNPAENELNIDSHLSDTVYFIYDTFGKQVLSGKSGNDAINISSLNPGFYMIEVLKNGKSFRAKFVKERN
ncbi:MAG: T9SS type A sorting domain-containing protein [Bacteroidales bacterium]